MSLINQPQNPMQQTQPSVADLQTALKTQTVQQITNLFNQLKNFCQQTKNEIFENTQLTPAEALAAFGTDAAELFILAGMVANVLNSVVPNSIDLTPPYPITTNQDGIVILTPTA